MAPEIAEAYSHGFKTMHRTLDSIRLPLADILSLFNDIRRPEKSSEVRQEQHSPQEGVDLRDQKKTPKQAGDKSVNRKIHKGRHLVQVHGAFRDMGHTPAHGALFPIDIQCFLTFGYPVCACVCVCVSVCVCVCESVNLSSCQVVC